MNQQYTADANAELMSMRAAELAIEQQVRYNEWMKTHSRTEELDFYMQINEAEASRTIARFLNHYAVLKGYVDPLQELRVTRPTNRDRVSDDR